MLHQTKFCAIMLIKLMLKTTIFLFCVSSVCIQGFPYFMRLYTKTLQNFMMVVCNQTPGDTNMLIKQKNMIYITLSGNIFKKSLFVSEDIYQIQMSLNRQPFCNFMLCFCLFVSQYQREIGISNKHWLHKIMLFWIIIYIPCFVKGLLESFICHTQYWKK